MFRLMEGWRPGTKLPWASVGSKSDILKGPRNLASCSLLYRGDVTTPHEEVINETECGETEVSPERYLRMRLRRWQAVSIMQKPS